MTLSPMSILSLVAAVADTVEIPVSSLVVVVPASMILAGIVMLIGSYYINRHFRTVEFPAAMKTLEHRLDESIAGTKSNEAAINRVLVRLERHDLEIEHQGRRLSRLERHDDVRTGRENKE